MNATALTTLVAAIFGTIGSLYFVSAVSTDTLILAGFLLAMAVLGVGSYLGFALLVDVEEGQ
jgi:hypothetical protein